MSDQPERIAKVALCDGEAIFSLTRPLARHGHLFRELHRIGAPMPDAEQGFLTDHGRFVDRIAGLKIATEAGQIVRKTGRADELYSEDLW